MRVLAEQESWEAEITKLLFEWQQAEDDGGQVYYHNAEKQLSMWEHPSLVFLPRQYMLPGYEEGSRF